MKCVRRLAGVQRPAPSAESPRKPEPRFGRFRARLFPLLPVLALLLGAFGPFAAAPAQAQTALVSNVGQTDGGTHGFTNPIAQQFTTGSNVGGYTLTSIEWVFATAATDATKIRAQLWNTGTDGRPGSNEANLTVPSTVGAGAVTFTAPSNTEVKENTSYYVILYQFGGTAGGTLRGTTSNNEDSGGATGWSIANTSYSHSSGTWSESATDVKLKVRVNGRAGGRPPVAPKNLDAVAGDARLDLSWQGPGVLSRVTGYDVHYTSAASGTVADGAAASGNDPSTAWVAVNRGSEADPPATSQRISGLTNHTAYRVRVRAVNGNGNSAWVTGTGTPAGSFSVWSATLTPKALGTGTTLGCLYARPSETCPPPGGLSDDTFTLNATTYKVTGVVLDGGDSELRLFLNNTGKPSLKALKFCVGSTGFALSSLTALHGRQANWNSGGLSWTAGTPVGLSIGTSCASGLRRLGAPGAPTALTVTPGNAQLALSWTAPSGAVTGYDVHYTSAASGTVANNAAVQTGGSPTAATGWVAVSRTGTTASQTISSLSNGTAYRVRVRAKNANGAGSWLHGTGTPQAPSTDATLSGLTASSSTSQGGTYSALTLTPSTFSATTLSYTASVPNATTHVKVTPRANHGSATLGVRKGTTGNFATVSSGSASDAIALGVGSNAITVRVTAEDETTTKDYTVTVTRRAAQTPPAGTTLVSNIGQAAGDTRNLGTAVTSHAQGFSTGSASNGYTLSSIEVTTGATATTSQRATIKAELWSAAQGGGPSTKVASLAVPSTVEAGTVAFAAPSNTVLKAGTTYYFVVYTIGAFNMQLALTASDDEDSSGQSGWTIANDRYFGDDTPTRDVHFMKSRTTLKLKLRVKGTVKPSPPAAPAKPAVTATATELAVSWTAPDGHGSAITAYHVQYAGSDTSLTITSWRDNLTGTSTTITGLKPGIQYWVRVRARNAVGWSGWSVWTILNTPTTVPGKPAVTVGARNGGLDVSWTVAETGGTAITGYAVHYKETTAADAPATTANDPSTGWVAVSRTETDPPTASQRISSLTNGTGYDVRVRATNSVGDGPWSDTGQGTPALTVPAAPAKPAVTATATTLAVSWTAPDGYGSAITAYHVVYAGSDTSLTITNWRDNLPGTSTTITGLKPGIEYWVRVRARNAVGWGEWSGWTILNTPTTVPGKPAVTVGARNGGLDVSWTAETGGTAITGYTVQYKETTAADAPATTANDPSTGWVEVTRTETDPPTASQRISGLTNGTGYDVRVRATNSVGDGPWSDTTQGTPALPAAPAGLEVGARNGGLDLRWDAAPVATGYDVHYTSAPAGSVADGAAVQTGGSPSAATGWVAVSRGAETDPPAASQRISGLNNGTDYRVRVRAVEGSVAGAWAHGTGTPALAVPSAPAAPSVTARATSLAVSWTAPDDRGSPITAYEVRYAGSDTNLTNVYWRDDLTGTSATITGLKPGVTYWVSMRARNSAGWGGWSGWTIRTTPIPAPKNLDVAAGSAKLDLRWTAPAGPVTGYDVHYTSSTAVADGAAVQTGGSASAANGWVAAARTGTDTTPSQAISGLGNGTDYRVRVRAKFAAGDSAWLYGAGTPNATGTLWWATLSAKSLGSGQVGCNNAVTGAKCSSPSVLSDDDFRVGGRDISVSFIRDTGTGRNGRLWVGFSTSNDALKALKFCAGTTAYALSGIGLDHSTSILSAALSWSAGNTVNVSIGSSCAGSAPAAQVPAAPTNLGVTAGDGKLDLRWTASAGATDYEVHYTSAPSSGQGAVADDADASGSNPAAAWVDARHGGTAASHRVSGLDNGTTYRLRVRAKNLVGGASAWLRGAGTPRVPPPAAPTGLDVVPSDGKLDLRWTAPAGQVTGYDVHYTSSTAVAPGAAVQTGGSASAANGWVAAARTSTDTTASQAITGLSNGRAHRVRVRARNAGGESAWRYGAGTPNAAGTVWWATLTAKSLGSGQVGCANTVAGARCSSPSVLSDDDFRVGGADISVSFIRDTGTDHLGQLFVGFSTSNNALKALKFCVGTTAYALSGIRSAHDFATLSAALSWSVGDTVSLSIGTSCPQVQVPAAPTRLDVTPGNAQLALSWTAPSGAVTGYDVHYTSALAASVGNGAAASGNDASAAWVAVPRTETDPPAASQTIPSLANGTAYRVRVRAKNANGAGPWLHGTGTPVAPPAAPTDLDVAPGNAQLALSWTAPSGTVTGYDVHYTSADAGTVADAAAASGNDASAAWVATARSETDPPTASQTIPSLANGTSYRVRVRAKNAGGAGPWLHGTGTPVPLPAAPTDLDVTPGNAQLALSWTAPAGTVTGYDVHYTSALAGSVADGAAASGSNPAAAWVAVPRSETDPPAASQTIPSLANGTAYRVRVRAKNVNGAGPWLHGTGTPVAPPAAPTDLNVAPGSAKLDLTWTAPAGTVTGYDVHYTSAPASGNNAVTDAAAVQTGGSPSAADGWVAVSRTEADPPAASQTISSLSNGTAYRVRVRAKNSGGAGPWLHGTGTTFPAGTVWQATLNVKDVSAGGNSYLGCYNQDAAAGNKCSTAATLTDDDFTVGGASHSVSLIMDRVISGQDSLLVNINPSPGTAVRALKFCVGSTAHALSTAGSTGSTAFLWTGTDVGWSAGDAVKLSIGSSCPQGSTPPATQPPAAPTDLTVTPGDAKLALSWTAPSGTLTGYDVHYTSAPASGSNAVTDAAAVQTGGSATAADGWLAVSRGAEASPPTASQTVSSLSNGTAYRVRVRAKNAAGAGPWLHGTGTPVAVTIGFQEHTELLTEGRTENLSVGLSAALQTDTTVGLRVGDSCRDGDYGRATETDDFTLSTKTLSFPAGTTRKSVAVTVVADRTTEGFEDFCLELVPPQGAPYALGPDNAAWQYPKVAVSLADVSRTPGLNILAPDKLKESAKDRVELQLGTSAPSGGTAVTLSLGTGTATETTDFKLSSKSVTIAEGQQSAIVTLTIVDDTVDDDAETIVLQASSTTPTFTASPVTVTIVDDDPAALTTVRPANAAAAPGPESLSVTWTAQTTGAGPHPDYAPVVEWRQKSPRGSWFRKASNDYTVISSPYVIEDGSIVAGVAYDVRVGFRAYGKGDPVADPDGDPVIGRTVGTWVSAGSATPNYAPPTAPRNVRLIPGDAKLTLLWEAPASWGSWEAEDFQVQAKRSTGVPHFSSALEGTRVGRFTPDSTSFVFTGEQRGAAGLAEAYDVTNGTAYDLRIRAISQQPGTDGSEISHFLYSPWTEVEGTPQAGLPDGPTSISLSVNDTDKRLAEGATATVTATLNAVAHSATTVTLSIGDASTATEGAAADFTLSPKTLTIAAGAKSATATLTVRDDTAAETDEVVVIEAASGSLTGATLNVAIVDDDQAIGAPTGLSVTPGDGTLALAWTAPSGTVTGYDVEHKERSAPDAAATGDGTDPSTGWVAVARGTETSPPAASQTVSSLTNGTAYDVRVRAKAAGGNSLWTAGGGTPSDKVLATPGNFALVAGDGEMTASWDAVANADRYVVSYGVAGSGTTQQAEAGAALTVTIDNLVNGTAYAATVQALDSTESYSPSAQAGWLQATPVAAASTDATLLSLTASSSTSAGGTYSALALTSTGGGNRTATVAYATTHVKVTPTANHAAATLGVRKGASGSFATVASGAASAAIALAVGSNAVTVRVTAADGTTVRDYTVTVTRQAQGTPGAPTGLTVAAGDAKLDLTWTAPSGTVTGYDVHYTSAPDSGNNAVADNAAVQTGGSATAADGWLAVSRSGTTASQTIPDLANGTAYRVRVRARNAALAGVWTHGTGTPAAAGQSSDAALRALTASASTSSGGTYSALTLSPSFDTATLSYAATVPHATTHLKLTPTANHAAATVAVRKGASGSFATVARGSASAAIALDVGANAVTVRVTAENASTQDYTVTVTRAQSSDATLRGLTASSAESAGGTYAALAIGTFSAGTTSYAAAVPNATTHVRLTPTANHAAARVGVRKGASGSFASVASGRASRAIALGVGANAITVRVTAQDASTRDYTVTVTREAPGPLTASLEGVPDGHDGKTAFSFLVRLSEPASRLSKPPRPASFRMRQGLMQRVEQAGAYLWRVWVKPASPSDVQVTLAGGRGCAEAGAVCTRDGRALQNTVKAMVGSQLRIFTWSAFSEEGRDPYIEMAVQLSRIGGVEHTVTVDWATADATTQDHVLVEPDRRVQRRMALATEGADYTAASGTLTFAPGEWQKNVKVAVLDDAIDEGTEYFLVRFSNPQGASLALGQEDQVAYIGNDDHLQAMWLARFGRTVGSQVTDAVSERLEAGLSPGAHVRLAGQPLDLSREDDARALAEAMTGLARAFGAEEAPAAGDPGSGAGAGSFARRNLFGAWDDPAAATGARPMTGREVLLGSSFHLASKGAGSGPGFATWGRAVHGSFDGEHADDTGRTGVDGEVLTGTLGADAEWRRVLAGVAVSVSKGEGKYDSPGVDRGESGSIESRLTTVSPYARFRLTERVSAWSLAGWGTGDMTIRFDGGGMAPIRTDIELRMGAMGARGALLEQDETGGMDLALRADAFFVRTDSEKAVNSAAAEADASRVRLVLEGGRRFALSQTATLRPSLELGVRHDGGDAETGTGFEIGGGVAWSDAASGLSIEARARVLLAHADSDYREWGASAAARLDPGERGRGLSFSLAPVIGSAASASERLWGARDARGLAPGGEFEAARGLHAEAGYGLPVLGDRFTGTPNVGFGMSDGGARDWRVGWRLTRALPNDPGFELNLDATRNESAGGESPPAHEVMLRAAIRW